jgi:ADP-L-glycero-D-manno-heptose 6-epimerase
MYRLINDQHNGENGLYNLGTGQARSFADLVKATFAAMGKDENIVYIDMPESLRNPISVLYTGQNG